MLWRRWNFIKRPLSFMHWVVLHHTSQKNMKKSHFSRFFSIFAYGLNRIFVFFNLTCYHKKMWKNVLKKKHKKNGIFFFKTLFYFSKMDKNNCPKKFLKKKFQKTGIFCFFHSLFLYKNYQNIPENRDSCFENLEVKKKWG